MSIKIDLSGLNNFQQELLDYQNGVNGYVDRVLTAILEKGVQYAQEEYAGIPEINCYYKKGKKNGNGQIIAEDTRTTDASQPNSAQIAYLEFGYGVEGEGTYEGTLPAKGVDQTGSWTYYYASEYKDNILGVQGWWTKLKSPSGQLEFVTGEKAGNHMYRVFKRLTKDLPTIIGSVK